MQQDSKKIVKGLPRRILLMLLDCGLIVFCYWLAVMLRFDSGEAYQRTEILRAMAPMLYYVLPIYMIVFWFGGLYEIMWEYAGMRDLARLTCLSGLATGLIMLFDLFYRSRPISGAVLIFGAVFNTAAIAGVRFLWRLIKTLQDTRANKPESQTPLLIVGAGNAGAWAVNLCKNKNQSFGNPICIVDDDLTKKGLRVQGVPVRGTISDIPELVRKYHIMEIVIAITTLKGDRLSEIINLCNSTHCRVRMLSDPQAVDDNGNPVAAGFRELNTADFLSRDEIQLNNAQISEYLHDKVVLVTGGGGSIGSELCRQIMRYQPRRLLIFDIYENCAYELETELRNKYGADAPIITLIGSIRDMERLNEVFETYHPSVVFHAAAHKHVPLMEISPAEAVKNNVFGTKNLLTAAAEHGVERFVQLSTDKAVNPTNVMGCTKRLCEMLIQSFDSGTDMKCMAVRFGNVLGSHGSVIPLFEEQIKRGGPVTITHPEIVRYFMTITEAAQLVLQAGGLAKGGSIYVLDMGEPVKIMDLANRLIRFYGYEPGVNMQVKITGLRPGEKLYEELLMDTEQDKMRKTAHNKIFIAPPMDIDLADFYNGLQALHVAAHHNDDAVVECLQHMVPGYHPNRRVRADHTVVAMTGNTGLFSKEEVEKQMNERQNAEHKGSKTMYQRYGKRLLDFLLSLVAVVVLAIPMAIIALWIKCDSPGPVFFKQRRVGRGKTHFNILKFRTMRGDTPHDVPTHLLKNPDSYITKSGAFLRKTSLDELPQIYNILVGQMSIIGPRPALYNQYDLIEARDRVHANDIRPGLTGLAQVNGRDELPIDVKARYDGEYAANLTFGMDLKIFFRSFSYVFQRRGVVEGGTGAMQDSQQKPSSK